MVHAAEDVLVQPSLQCGLQVVAMLFDDYAEFRANDRGPRLQLQSRSESKSATGPHVATTGSLRGRENASGPGWVREKWVDDAIVLLWWTCVGGSLSRGVGVSSVARDEGIKMPFMKVRIVLRRAGAVVSVVANPPCVGAARSLLPSSHV